MNTIQKNVLMGQRSLPNFIKIKEEHMFSAIKYLVDENKKLIKEIDGFTTYYLPENLLGIIWKGKYKGQRQKWFICFIKFFFINIKVILSLGFVFWDTLFLPIDDLLFPIEF